MGFEQVNALFSNLIDLNDNVVKSTYRIGNTNSSKPRLLKVVCRDIDTKRALLSRAKHLRSAPNYKNVYLNTVLTPLQQNENKILREELKRRRDFEEDLIIRHGKIVSRKIFQSSVYHAIKVIRLRFSSQIFDHLFRSSTKSV